MCGYYLLSYFVQRVVRSTFELSSLRFSVLGDTVTWGKTRHLTELHLKIGGNSICFVEL